MSPEKKRYSFILSLAIATGLLTISGSRIAHASLVKYDLTGTIDSGSDVPGVPSGSAITGTFSFDPSLARPTTPGGSSFDLPFSLSLLTNGKTLTYTGGPSNFFGTDRIVFEDMPGTQLNNLTVDSSIRLFGHNIFDSAPAGSLAGGHWDRVTNGRFFLGQLNPGNGFDATFSDVELASLPTAPVPEPSTLAMFGSAIIGLGIFKRKRG